jgi:hypothetical protein
MGKGPNDGAEPIGGPEVSENRAGRRPRRAPAATDRQRQEAKAEPAVGSVRPASATSG